MNSNNLPEQQTASTGQQALVRRTSSDELSYRLVSKSFFCHTCRENFKKMVPSLEEIDISCPKCNQYFCEEITNQNASSLNNPRNFYQERATSPS